MALYALAVVLLTFVAAPNERVVASPGPATGPAPRPPELSGPEIAQELIDAPRFAQVEKPRSIHVNRSWQMVGGVGVNVVTVNPKAPNVHIVLGLAEGTVLSKGRFGRETFGDMVRRFRPRVAVNGTYFNMRTNEPVGALVMEGRLIYDGLCSVGLLINEQGDAWFEYHPGAYGRHIGWQPDIATAICAGPSLLKGGRLNLHPGDEGFSDPSLFALARRTAVGVTGSGKLLFITIHTPINLNKLAHIMMRLGCVDAMNLDGGSSCGLYSNGQYITLPKRQLTNLILIYD